MLDSALQPLVAQVRQEVEGQGVDSTQIQVLIKAHLRYSGTDSSLEVNYDNADAMRTSFEAAHKQRFGFVTPERPP